MRRWLLVFLIAFLPLQFASAAAAVYCAHERDSAPKHLGHHADGVSVAQKSLGDDQGPGGASPSTDHFSCAYVHLGCAVHPVLDVVLRVEPTSKAKPFDAPAQFRSCTWAVLDRPQWSPHV